MKKLATIGLLCFSILVTSCGTSDVNKTNGGNLFGNNVSAVNADFVAANIYQDPLTTKIYDLTHKESPSRLHNSDTILDATHYSNGLLLTRNSTNHIGFYSSILNDYILPPQYNVGWVDYNIVDTNYVGSLINIHFEDKYYTYDVFGNRLLNTEYQSYSEKIVNRTVYLGLNDYSVIYAYDFDGSVTKVTSIPTAEVDVDDYDGPEQGTLYQEGRYDLEDYGYAGYSLFIANTGLITTYHDNKTIATFYADLNTYTLKGIIGTKLVLQRSINVPEEYEHYNYIKNGTKYSLETLLIDFMDGKEEKKDASLVINSIIPCKKPSNYQGAYSYVVYQLINDNMILTDTVAAIIDDRFDIRDNVSGHAPEMLIKLSNGNYYNTSTGYIYGADLNIITSIKDANPTYYKNLKVFVGTYEGKYGVIDENGVIIYEFLYNNIYASDAKEDNIIATIDDMIYRLPLKNRIGNPTYVGNTITRIDRNFFKANDNIYFSSDKTIFTAPSDHTIQNFSKTFFNKHIVYFYAEYHVKDNVTMIDAFHSVYYDNFTPKVTSQGTEISVPEPNGETFNTAANLTSGYNKLHRVGDNDVSYGQFSAEEEGYYSFYLPYTVDIANQMINGEQVHYHEESKTIGGKSYYNRYVVYVKANSSVTLEFHYANTVYQVYDLNIVREVGVEQQYPLIVTDTNTHNFSAPATVPTDLYVRFTAPLLGKYKVNSSDATITAVTVNNENVNEGKIIGQGNTYVFKVSFSFSKIANSLRFVRTAENVPQYYHQENPYLLEYGNHSSVNQVFTTQNYEKAYLAFKSVYGGYYYANTSFSYDTDVTLNPQAYLVNSVGVKTVLDESEFYIEPGGYFLLELSPVTSSVVEGAYASVTLTSYTISSSTGRSYENPASFSSSINNSSDYPRYYYYHNSSDYSNFLFTYNMNSSNLAYIQDNNLTYFDSNETLMNIPSNSDVIFRLPPNSYVNNQSMQSIIINPTPLTDKEGPGEIELIAGATTFYRYTNNGEQTIQLNINVSEGNGLYFAYSTSKNYLLNSQFDYIYNSNQNYGYFNLAPGKSIVFAIRNNTSLPYSPTITFEIVDY